MMTQSLDDLMEFDTVVYSYGDGVNAEVLNISAPYFEGEDWLEAGWELIKGRSNQYGYSGPAFDPSEYIGGGLADDILNKAGYYCALYDLDDDCGDAWFIAYREEL